MIFNFDKMDKVWAYFELGTFYCLGHEQTMNEIWFFAKEFEQIMNLVLICTDFEYCLNRVWI